LSKEKPSESEARTIAARRNPKLEELLVELNQALSHCADRFHVSKAEVHPKIFVVGPMRSGSTIFMQWLAQSRLCGYPTNMLSRFYGAPLIGAKIQQLLTDPAYNFKNEILDFNSEVSFFSENGKTRGALAPNEFWYFWRRFLPFSELDYLPDEKLRRHPGLAHLRDELNGLANVFGRPFGLKAMIMNQNIPVLAELFNKAIFVWVRRDPIFNMQAALLARLRQYGDMATWYSFKIKEYAELSRLDPLHSVAGQVFAINRSIESALAELPEEKKMIVGYEDFCTSPGKFFDELRSKLATYGGATDDSPYAGEAAFKNTNAWRLMEYSEAEAIAAYEKMRLALAH
jgi:hypothetical protein